MSQASNDNNPRKTAGKIASQRQPSCPICGEDAYHDYRPFCSKRCADIDLGHWLNGKYVIEADPGGEEAESIPEPFKGSGADNENPRQN